MSILNLIRPELLHAPSDAAGGPGLSSRMHANELPWSPLEIDAINLNHYPDGALQKKVQAQLAARYQINPDQLVLTRGSDEGIDLLTRLFLTAGQDALMQFPPTFPMFEFYVRLQQARLLQCPLDEGSNFSLSLEKLKACWDPSCKIIMFCSPNNPTGNLVDLELIATVCALYAKQSVVVVDEAYIEFANTQSATNFIARCDNLVVLRTLSKAYGMAGLRLGCVIAQAPVIQALKKISAPYTLSNLVLHAATQALNNEVWFDEAIAKIQSQRDALIKYLQQSPIINKIYPTEANFILIKTDYAQELTAWLASKDIAIRDFPRSSSLENHLRISVGDSEQNQFLMDAMSTFTQSRKL